MYFNSEKLVEWQREQAAEINKLREELVAQQGDQSIEDFLKDPAHAFEVGKLTGAQERINAFSAFLITHSDELLGKLEPERFTIENHET